MNNTINISRLLSNQLIYNLPALSRHDTNKGTDASRFRVFAHFSSKVTKDNFYMIEYDPNTQIFYGLYKGNYAYKDEIGLFHLDELEAIDGLKRDTFWNSKTTLLNVMEKYKYEMKAGLRT